MHRGLKYRLFGDAGEETGKSHSWPLHGLWTRTTWSARTGIPGIRRRHRRRRADPIETFPIFEGASNRERTDRSRLFRESLDTLILGAIATSIGMVLWIVLFAAIVRRPVPGWNERAITGAAPYFIPSKDAAIGATAGEFIGLAGLLLGWRRRRAVSPLSALGTAACLGQIYLFFVYVVIMEHL